MAIACLDIEATLGMTPSMAITPPLSMQEMGETLQTPCNRA